MRFSTRNAFYLRASNYRVVPLFLYLDERHVDWMEDRVLQMVIVELQPKMGELLVGARSQKKHKVHVERGDGYQYCYFLRTTTRTEVVLLKQKEHSLRAPTPPPRSTPLVERPKKRQRGSAATGSSSSRRSRARSTSVSTRGGSPTPTELEAEEDDAKDEPPVTPVPRSDEDEGVNIKDWKPDVDVTYQGFGTSSLQLVLIVEPYPPLAPSEYAPPSSRLSSRSASIAASRSRSRQTTGQAGSGTYSRYSSTSLALDGGARQESQATPNMRNASRSVSAVPNSRRGGESSTPLREASQTPGPSGSRGSGGRAGRGPTPLFMSRDTPFGDEDEDEEAHEEYTSALREGRLRLPSVSRQAGTPGLDEDDGSRRGKRRSRSRVVVDEDESLDDIPETLEAMSGRLVRSSEIEEGVVRVQGGWEERAEGEESAVMGREEPGD